MKTLRRFLALLMLAALLCAFPLPGALAWKIKTGEANQGSLFQGSGVSFLAPPDYTLHDITQADDADYIMLRGPASKSGYSTELNVTLRREPFDLESESVDADLQFIASDLKGKFAVCAADERLTVNGADVQRRIFIFRGAKTRPDILIRYRWNISGAGVMADYLARAEAASVPDDLAALPALVESFKVE